MYHFISSSSNMSIPLEDDQGTPPVSGYNIPPYPQSNPYSPWTSSKLPEYQNRWPLLFISYSKLCKLIFQSRKGLQNHKCLFIRLSVNKTPQQLEIIILHLSSFILHSSFIILHSSFIHPSFISRLLSFSACLIFKSRFWLGYICVFRQPLSQTSWKA